MAKAKWKPFPHPDKAYVYAGEALKKNWERLHRGDCEPWPKDSRVQEAWRAYHRGDFAEAVALGLESGGAGITVANKARSIYANGVEAKAERRMELFQESMEQAEEQNRGGAEEPERPLPVRLRRGTLQPGHLGGEGPGPGAGRAHPRRARGHAQARPEACRGPYRDGHLPRRDHRQGGRAGGRD